MLSAAVRANATARPGAEAVVGAGARLTYAELDRAVDGVAARLLRAGVRPGATVAAWLSNRVEYVLVLVACSRVGAVLAPLNPRLAVPEVVAILRASGACLLVGEREHEGADRSGELHRLGEHLWSPAIVLDVDGPEPLGLDAPDLDAVREREAAVRPDDAALLLFTSGTTGRPKGAILTHAALEAAARAAAAVDLFRGDDRILVQTPCSTTAGTVIQAAPGLLLGATLVLLPRFSAEASLAAIEAERITCSVAPPTMLALQLGDPGLGERDLSSLRLLITGAAPVPPDLARRVVATLRTRLVNAYGATETGGLVTYLPADAPAELAATTCGRPIPGYDVRVVDGDGRELPPGEIGEILVGGPSLTSGYWRDEAQTAAALVDGRWRSGDLGAVDEDGCLRIAGRSKDMYIRGGYNVYPAEVEAVVQEVPGVVACAVVPYPDDVLGERGRAFVVPAAGAAPTLAEVRAFCSARIADYKAPDDLVLLDELPLVGPGKVDRARLRALAPERVA